MQALAAWRRRQQPHSILGRLAADGVALGLARLASPVTTDGTEVYWADDGGGLLTPSSWVVQYRNGTAWVDVGHQGGEPTALDTFNSVGFDPATTTKLRLSMQSTGTASVGVIQWVVPSVPGSS
jgi:hypothetical protein